MPPDDGSTLSTPRPDRLLLRLQDLLESGPGSPAGQTVELFLRQTRRVRVSLPGSDAGEVLSRSTETGLAVRRYHHQGGRAGFATVNLCDPEHYLAALRRTDQDPAPVEPGLEPAEPVAGGGGTGVDGDPQPVADEEGLSRWLAGAVERVEEAAGRITPVQVGQGWIEAGETAEALVNSRGLQAGRCRARIWAALQVTSEAGGDLFHRPRLLVPRADDRLPSVDPVLERMHAFPHYNREFRPEPGRPLVLLPEAAATLVQAVVWQAHGPQAGIGEPVGPGWVLEDDPHRANTLFGGRWDDTGRTTRPLPLADGSVTLAGLGVEGHGWRRSFRDVPQRGFSNLVVRETGGNRPDRGFLIAELRLFQLSRDRILAVARGNRLEDGAPAAEGGRIRFTFNPARIPARVAGSCGTARNTALGITTPDLVLDPGELNLLP